MRFHILFAGVVAASLACPLAAQAQGVPGGIAHGAYVGAHDAGPVGGLVGGVVGGVIGGVNGVLGVHPVSYSGDVGWCEAHFRSYNPATGMYLGYDGRHHPCR